jgi:two-component system sensor histidine kinase BaeS
MRRQFGPNVEEISIIGGVRRISIKARAQACFAMSSRLRLPQQLALLLLLTTTLAVLGLGGAMAWNLRSGFVDYLNARDEERLDRFVEVLSRRLAHRTLQEMAQAPRALNALLSELERKERGAQEASSPDDDPPEPPAEPMARPPRHGPARGGPPGWALRPSAEPLLAPLPPPPPPRPGPPRPLPGQEAAAFATRVTVLGLDGARLMGAPLREGRPWVERTVVVQGEPLARVRLALAPSVPEGLDSRFIRRQTLAMAAVAGGLWVLALGLAWLLSRRWVNRVEAVRKAASEIAQGHLSTRLPDPGGDELADLARSMNAMAQALQTLETSRRRWMAEMSHELRTPLAVLQGELEAIQDGVRPWSPSALHSLQAEVRQLTRLVDDLHLLALSDLDALPCTLAPACLSPVLAQWVQRLQPRAHERGLSLSLKQPDEPIWVRADTGRLEQLVMNLLENSLRYTDEPGQVEVTLRREARHAVLSVDDSAPGVPAQWCERLFEPLFRLDAARSRAAASGSGLGLSIAQAIAKAHGARLHAQASALGGLQVWLQLELAPFAQPLPSEAVGEVKP